LLNRDFDEQRTVTIISEREQNMKNSCKIRKAGIAFFLIVILLVAAIGIMNFGCFSSSGSYGKTYNANDADKNHDGNISGKEFQDLVGDYLDDHGY
jgi:hypothetical protein